MTKRVLAFLFVFLGVNMPLTGENGGWTYTVKRSFEKFEFFWVKQTPGLNRLCAEIDAPYEAKIQRTPGRNYWLELSWLEEGNPEVEDCLDLDVIGISCPVIRTSPARKLSNDEAARVRAQFRSINFHGVQVIDPDCWDPCLNVVVGWDRWWTTVETPDCDRYSTTRALMERSKLDDIWELLTEFSYGP
jgi:hypothetical protein